MARGARGVELKNTKLHRKFVHTLFSKCGHTGGLDFMATSPMPATRILIADDDAFLRELLVHKLSAAGHQVSTAEDGGSALFQAREMSPDLVILDAMMPILDGFEVLRRLRADPDTATIPVIMLTSLKREEDIVGALKLGAADYLVKPFIPDELVARIGRLLPRESADETSNGDRGPDSARHG
ncbi:MAG: response regulator transcription factor [Brevundimonas sp.]